ncbi:hypothetical protein C8J56DRAFT_895281 [Mycena floridula]|nr:hypothetical protein C8J56DRAFT_895281 [Mycena floridula]
MTETILLCAKCSNSLTFHSEDLDSCTVENIDSAVVTALAEEADAELEKYDLEIERGEERLKLLREQREKVLKKRNRCRYLASAIRHVPAETWLEILEFACIGAWTYQNPASRLAKVCKQWRDILLSTPACWTSFVVDVRENYGTKKRFIQQHRRLSDPLPLRVQVVFPTEDDTCQTCKADHLYEIDNDPHLNPTFCTAGLLRSLARISHRLIDLSFTGEAISALLWVQSLESAELDLSRGFGSLESLEIGSTSDRFEDSGEALELTIFAASSKLQNLILRGYAGGALPASNWTQLRHVELDNVDGFVVNKLLAQCPSIISADVRRPLYDFSGGALPSCIANSLESLKVWYPGRQSRLLRSMTLPALKSLEIRSNVDDEDLLALCTRSSFSLQKLKIRAPEKYTASWNSVFLSLQDLTSLTLLWRTELGFLLELANTDNLILPKMTVLRLSCDDEVDILQALMTATERRFDPRSSKVACLEKVAISVSTPIPVSDDEDDGSWSPPRLSVEELMSDRMKRLSEAGLDIRLQELFHSESYDSE